MRLAIVSLMGGFQWGGSESLWFELAKYSRAKGDEVLVSIYKWEPEHANITILRSQGAIIKQRNRFILTVSFLKKIKRFILNLFPQVNKEYSDIIDFEPDHIFISQGESFDIAEHHKGLYKLIKKNSIKYSFVCHNHKQFGFIPDKNIYPDAKEIFQNAKNIFFISLNQKSFVEKTLIVNLSNSRFTWNPINMQFPNGPLPYPKKVEIQFAIVGALAGEKGQDTIIHILSGDYWRNLNWHLNIYGKGDGILYLKDLVNYNLLGDKVTFHGQVNNIQDVWIKNHILLSASTMEGMPISLVEAMICGRPSVMTDVGGNAELIENFNHGILSLSARTKTFDSALRLAWENKENWEIWGINSFNKINGVLDRTPEKTVYDLLKVTN